MQNMKVNMQRNALYLRIILSYRIVLRTINGSLLYRLFSKGDCGRQRKRGHLEERLSVRLMSWLLDLRMDLRLKKRYVLCGC